MSGYYFAIVGDKRGLQCTKILECKTTNNCYLVGENDLPLKKQDNIVQGNIVSPDGKSTNTRDMNWYVDQFVFCSEDELALQSYSDAVNLGIEIANASWQFTINKNREENA